MNKVILIGRLTRDPDIRYSDNGHSVAKFSLAVDRKFKAEGVQGADFPNVVAFGKTAEFIEKYFRKGGKIVIEGRLQTGSYDHKDGHKVYTTDVIAESVEFGESKGASGGSVQPDNRPAMPSPTGDGFMHIPDDLDDESLPFN